MRGGSPGKSPPQISGRGYQGRGVVNPESDHLWLDMGDMGPT